MKTKTCIQCNREFTLSTSELEYYRENGLDEPKRCKDCRELNKLRGEGHGIVYDPAYGVKPDYGEQLVYKDVPGLKQKIQKQAEPTPKPNLKTNPKHPYPFLWALGCALFVLIYIALNSASKTAPTEVFFSGVSVFSLLGFLICLVGWAVSFYRSKAPTDEEKEAAKVYKNTSKAANRERNEAVQDQQIIYRFRCADFLDEHFEKHKAEVGAHSKTEYLKMANAVIFNKRTKKKRDPQNEDAVFFMPPTGEVVFVSNDGYIRSYYITKKSFQNI